ncbi:MAG: rhamnulokinase [Lachnospiraceae bacterium]|uniref:Rhamnulokinase n=1 Tax=Candidatus Weimeria bifida TaxID=2599074 RepID=A0A6N7IWY1_9FIRM|nr:rhamnulokinase [Candidatus Weimeria bifida]RRF96230.1 MAG: rhamnulokinase [Lachnospiraceae bacterium]
MSSEYLAVDIGASSGRHIVGTVDNKKINMTETYRFENGLIEKNGHKCWDIENLKNSVIAGIKETLKRGFYPETLGIDTWAVDFVLLDKNDEIIGDAVAYRDSRTNGICEELEKLKVISFRELYSKTGIQYQKFNTIYQLFALKKEHPDYFEKAETFLMIPDYLNFVLTGVKANEYTNATTTALVNAKTGDWDFEIIDRLGLPGHIFQEIQMPGTPLGRLRPEIASETGADIEVILPATHDTGSAFLSVPAKNDTSVFLSSGTWSLMGVENREAIASDASRAANFTNEGGYEHRFRYLKNIMGLWMNQNVRRELDPKPAFPDLIASAQKFSDIKTTVDVDDERFLAPVSMIDEIKKACAEKNEPIPDETGAVMQVIYNSLADDYAKTVKQLEKLTGKKFTCIIVVGGGSQDKYLNKLTSEASGLPVYCGPVEGTALGNLIVQFIHAGEFEDLKEARKAVSIMKQ